MLPAALVAAVVLAAAAGCGGDDDSSASGGGYGAPRGGDGTELTVTLYPEGPQAGEPRTAEVACRAGTSDAEACDAIEALPDGAAEPVPAGVACTEIYGGPDLVRLEGTLDGEEVDAELIRENGCEIDRFERFTPLLRALFPGYEPGAALRP